MPETPDAKDMTVQETSSSTLREAVRATREFANQTITSAKVNSPFAEDKLQAADGAVEKLIHAGYQGLKRIAVNGHPAVIVSCSGIAAALPSLPFGPRALIRNAGLAMVLATAMIYPDHLRGYVQRPSSEKSDPGN